MQGSDDFPDDVPVADAVEQHRAISEPTLDEEDSAGPPDERPLEAAGPDWQDQREVVDFDPEEDISDV
ncbi:hypothetical protein ACIA48_18905 [Mycobacterium sp. NPDC051804]|uniref:hypothetical protein n=1 Tax=Mycobacterium sp. NPDC051804 TaxID=3364295 RepID=UPI0037A53B7C